MKNPERSVRTNALLAVCVIVIVLVLWLFGIGPLMHWPK